MCLAVPGRILDIKGEDPLTLTGTVDFEGVRREVSLATVPEAVVGDYVLVHAGLAINVIDPEEAAGTLELLRSHAEEFEAESE